MKENKKIRNLNAEPSIYANNQLQKKKTDIAPKTPLAPKTRRYNRSREQTKLQKIHVFQILLFTITWQILHVHVVTVVEILLEWVAGLSCVACTTHSTPLAARRMLSVAPPTVSFDNTATQLPHARFFDTQVHSGSTAHFSIFR